MPHTKSKQAQMAIAKAINERGYGPGELTPDQYVAKQLVMALQELGEIFRLFDWPGKSNAPDVVRTLLRLETHRKLKHLFHDVEYFKRVELPYANRPFLDSEAADVVIPLLNAAEQVLGIDLLELCLEKAKRDISRGVTR